MLLLPILPADALITKPPAVVAEHRPQIARSYVRDRALDKGWSNDQWSCLEILIDKESKWDAQADNPNSSAYGLFQVLKTPVGLGVDEQVERGFKYIEHRYDNPCTALHHHKRRGWY